MLTTLDSSPTSSSTTSAFVQSCSSPLPDTQTTEQQREPVSPSKQDQSCAKHPSSRMKHNSRHTPYPDGTARSPGSCSSDGDSVQSDADNQDTTNPRVNSKVKRIAANSRERKRMHTVNSAFDQLRELVPTYPSNRKLSKIDTLRLACTYIQDLVSLLHNTQGIQGDDVLYQQPFPESFNGYPVAVKPEPMGDYLAFEHFRMPLRFPTDGCAESYQSSASESDSTTHSPPHQFMQQQVAPPPPTSSTATLASRPPPLTRVSSEGTATIHARMAEATISGGNPQQQQQQQSSSMSATTPLTLPPAQPTSMYQRQVNITSPLAMHSVHHTSPTPTLIQNSLGHHSPPPVWPRAATIPTYAHALYGQ